MNALKSLALGLSLLCPLLLAALYLPEATFVGLCVAAILLGSFLVGILIRGVNGS